jgi:hypothetical protein
MGVSSLYSDTILFESEDTEIRLDFSKFYKLEQNGNIIQLVLMPDEGMESPILEMIFEDKNQIQILKRNFTIIEKTKVFSINFIIGFIPFLK